MGWSKRQVIVVAARDLGMVEEAGDERRVARMIGSKGHVIGGPLAGGGSRAMTGPIIRVSQGTGQPLLKVWV